MLPNIGSQNFHNRPVILLLGGISGNPFEGIDATQANFQPWRVCSLHGRPELVNRPCKAFCNLTLLGQSQRFLGTLLAVT
jgi:hypothetical protein